MLNHSFSFSSFECETLPFFYSDQTKGSSSLTSMTGTTYPIHELNLKVNENLSYVNAKSQERREEHYYTIWMIYISISKE